MLRCKKALEKRIEKRHEVETSLKEKSESHKMNIRKELRDIAPLRETMEKELEHVGLVLKKLDAQTKEINLYRERRDKECPELNNIVLLKNLRWKG